MKTVCDHAPHQSSKEACVAAMQAATPTKPTDLSSRDYVSEAILILGAVLAVSFFVLLIASHFMEIRAAKRHR